MSTDRLPISTLTGESGHSAASAIRRTINSCTSDRPFKTIGLVDSRIDPTDYKFAYRPGLDMSATSWADLNVYGPDWRVLGRPEKFRVPGEGGDGGIITFPRLRDGALEVYVSLEEGAMGRLVQDEGFLKYAKLAG